MSKPTAEEEEEIEIDDYSDATEYSIGYSIPDNQVKIQFLNEFGVLSNFITDAAGAYEFANRILRAYDKLEGL